LAKVRAAIATTLAIIALSVTILLRPIPATAREEIRYVPQLELTDLAPEHVLFCPDDESLLLVVNRYKRIDVFDLSSPGHPVKITEIAANAEAGVHAASSGGSAIRRPSPEPRR
jgi:hypothetical protein